MRYHVPFAHRQRPYVHRAGPIYIGFDEPVSIQRRRGRRRFNWPGFTGLMLALVSPLTAFIIAPFALIFSLIGLRRSPRGMAVVGTVLSLLATAVLSLAVYGIASHSIAQHKQQQHALMMHQQRGKIADTRIALEEVSQELREYRSQHDFELPNALEGQIIAVQYVDAWGKELSYAPNSEGCIVRSAGPDGDFNTSDDIITKIEGKSAGDPYFDL